MVARYSGKFPTPITLLNFVSVCVCVHGAKLLREQIGPITVWLHTKLLHTFQRVKTWRQSETEFCSASPKNSIRCSSIVYCLLLLSLSWLPYLFIFEKKKTIQIMLNGLFTEQLLGLLSKDDGARRYKTIYLHIEHIAQCNHLLWYPKSKFDLQKRVREKYQISLNEIRQWSKHRTLNNANMNS